MEEQIIINKTDKPNSYRKCCICGECKKLDKFHKDRHEVFGRKYKCIECTKKEYLKNRDKNLLIGKRWREKNKHKKREYYVRTEKKSWANNIKRRYGLSEEDYESILLKQKGVCAICGKKDRRRLSVDHNHKSGSVRGLLCYSCNHAIGKFEEDKVRMLKAIKYLGSHNG